MEIQGTELEVVRGSVLEQDVDVIVNAANTGMRGGGALDGAIHRAAGRAMLSELIEVAPQGSRTAEVVVTKGHNLPQKFVFHVAGPVWSLQKAEQCRELLAQSYRNCLIEADDRTLESIGFPSISTGVYAFPLEEAAPLALSTTVEFLQSNPQTSLQRIVFAMFGGPEHHVFSRALKALAHED